MLYQVFIVEGDRYRVVAAGVKITDASKPAGCYKATVVKREGEEVAGDSEDIMDEWRVNVEPITEGSIAELFEA